ncbi:hypothetical protein HII31_11113 [Pseudocercospora fuligena]|uniref:BTB domain-containing protein n=1 Tax=Pseudocercospora fuligena TaxID=685502 RepID=A0A8H6RAR0_9PEZI|nr:hypothetical protein HII31_11113 [Pseudocercospora fuligena]
MAEELWKSLQTQDRLIKLTIGDSEKAPVYVQQKLLESVAPWFENALKRDTFVEGETGSLSFPEDDVEAWKVLVCWTMKRISSVDILDPDAGPELAAKCWVLGDKYDIVRFQDEAMTAILKYFRQTRLCALSREKLNRTLDVCPPDSKLAEYMTMEIAHYMATGDIDWEQASVLHLGHLWEDFCKARSDSYARGWQYWSAGGFKAPRMSYHRGGQYMIGKKVLANVDAESDRSDSEED